MEYSKKQGQSKVSTSGASWKYTLPCIGRIFKRTIPSVSRICYKIEPKITFSDYLSHLQILLYQALASSSINVVIQTNTGFSLGHNLYLHPQQ